MKRVSYQALEKAIDEWNHFYGLEYREQGFLLVRNDGTTHWLSQITEDGTTKENDANVPTQGTIRSCFDCVRHVENPWPQRPIEGVFTVGNEVNYDKGLRDHGEKFQKAGRSPNYSGGYACQSVDSAERLIRREGKEGEWAIYELEAQWGVDTVQSANGWWHALVNASRVIRKVVPEKTKGSK